MTGGLYLRLPLAASCGQAEVPRKSIMISHDVSLS